MFADIYGTSTDIYGCTADIYGRSTDVFVREHRQTQQHHQQRKQMTRPLPGTKTPLAPTRCPRAVVPGNVPEGLVVEFWGAGKLPPTGLIRYLPTRCYAMSGTDLAYGLANTRESQRGSDPPMR
eukprot:36459-Rhodomonas_salina.2